MPMVMNDHPAKFPETKSTATSCMVLEYEYNASAYSFGITDKL